MRCWERFGGCRMEKGGEVKCAALGVVRWV